LPKTPGKKLAYFFPQLVIKEKKIYKVNNESCAWNSHFFTDKTLLQNFKCGIVMSKEPVRNTLAYFNPSVI
jgi:hypothetical protein